jgi:molybdopterin-guanine dinucleotide biosynthesis protein A
MATEAWSAPPLVAGLLVGGASRRMGRPKALVEWDGVALAERVVSAARAAVAELVLLGDGPVPDPLSGCERIADAPEAAGPLAALLAALAARPGSAWILLGCDQPLVSPAAIRWLRAQRRRERIAILPRRGPERVEPLLAIYEPSVGPVLAALRGSGDFSLQPLARRGDVATPRVPEALAAAWTSVDTPEELAALQRSGSPPGRV